MLCVNIIPVHKYPKSQTKTADFSIRLVVYSHQQAYTLTIQSRLN